MSTFTTAAAFAEHLNTCDSLKIAHTQSEDGLMWLFHNNHKHEFVATWDPAQGEQVSWQIFLEAKQILTEQFRTASRTKGFPAATTN